MCDVWVQKTLTGAQAKQMGPQICMRIKTRKGPGQVSLELTRFARIQCSVGAFRALLAVDGSACLSGSVGVSSHLPGHVAFINPSLGLRIMLKSKFLTANVDPDPPDLAAWPLSGKLGPRLCQFCKAVPFHIF